MKRFFIFNSLIMCIGYNLSAHPYCITQDHQKDNDRSTTMLGTTNPVNPGCSCPCNELRFGGNDVCVTCTHRHSADTSRLPLVKAPGHVEISAFIAKQHAAQLRKRDYSDAETE